jgi:hypothetical protein
MSKVETHWWWWVMTKAAGKLPQSWPEGQYDLNGEVYYWMTWQGNLFNNEE